MSNNYLTKNPDGTNTGHIVIIIMLDKNKNLLLLHRIDNNKWEPPKGSIDVINNVPEKPLVAAHREIIEETGITDDLVLTKLAQITDYIVKSPTITYTLEATIYKCQLDTVNPKITINSDPSATADHKQYKWIALSEIDTYELYPDSFRGLVEKYIIS